MVTGLSICLGTETSSRLGRRRPSRRQSRLRCRDLLLQCQSNGDDYPGVCVFQWGACRIILHWKVMV
jgi:hypothetical protein